jgi:hypothetical protein
MVAAVRPKPVPQPHMQRGTLAAMAMIGLAAALAGLAFWVRLRAGDAALAFWTPEAAVLVAHAPQAELWLLEPRVETQPPAMNLVEQAGRRWAVAKVYDLSAVGGLSHARTVLLEDASFAWEQRIEDGPGQWQYALAFRDGPRQAVVLLDLGGGQAALAGQARRVSIVPLAPRLQAYFDDVVSQADLVTKRPTGAQ